MKRTVTHRFQQKTLICDMLEFECKRLELHFQHILHHLTSAEFQTSV